MDGRGDGNRRHRTYIPSNIHIYVSFLLPPPYHLIITIYGRHICSAGHPFACRCIVVVGNACYIGKVQLLSLAAASSRCSYNEPAAAAAAAVRRSPPHTHARPLPDIDSIARAFPTPSPNIHPPTHRPLLHTHAHTPPPPANISTAPPSSDVCI